MYLYFILIGILIIVAVNFLLHQTDLIAERIIRYQHKKYIPLKDDKYIYIIEDLKQRLNIKLKTHLLFNPKALQENCLVSIYNNEIYIIINKNINEKRFKFSMAHEFGHIIMRHSERQKPFMQNYIFLLNIFLTSFLLYPLINIKVFIYIVLITYLIQFLYQFVFLNHIKRKFELEADTVAAEVLPIHEIEDAFNAISKSTKLISSIPLPYNSHPTIKSRLRNIRKINKIYNR